MNKQIKPNVFAGVFYSKIILLLAVGVSGCFKPAQTICIEIPVRTSLIGSGPAPIIEVDGFQSRQLPWVDLSEILSDYLFDHMPAEFRKDSSDSAGRPIWQLEGNWVVWPEPLPDYPDYDGGRIEITFDLREVSTGYILRSVTMMDSCRSLDGPPIHRAVKGLANRFLDRLTPRQSSHRLSLARGESKLDEQGRRMAMRQDYAGALRIFQQAIDVDPAGHCSMYNAGLMCLAMDRYEEASSYFKRVQKLAPQPEYHRAIEIAAPLIEKP